MAFRTQCFVTSKDQHVFFAAVAPRGWQLLGCKEKAIVRKEDNRCPLSSALVTCLRTGKTSWPWGQNSWSAKPFRLRCPCCPLPTAYTCFPTSPGWQHRLGKCIQSIRHDRVQITKSAWKSPLNGLKLILAKNHIQRGPLIHTFAKTQRRENAEVPAKGWNLSCSVELLVWKANNWKPDLPCSTSHRI